MYQIWGKRHIVTVFLPFGMAVSLLGSGIPSYAAPLSGDAEEPVISIECPTEEITSLDEVQGEAIVCFRQDRVTKSRSEEAIMAEQEKEIEGEAFVDDAEAILLVDSPEEALSEDLHSGEKEAGNAPFMVPGDEDADLPGVITLVQSDHLSTTELISRR